MKSPQCVIDHFVSALCRFVSTRKSQTFSLFLHLSILNVILAGKCPRHHALSHPASRTYDTLCLMIPLWTYGDGCQQVCTRFYKMLELAASTYQSEQVWTMKQE